DPYLQLGNRGPGRLGLILLQIDGLLCLRARGKRDDSGHEDGEEKQQAKIKRSHIRLRYKAREDEPAPRRWRIPAWNSKQTPSYWPSQRISLSPRPPFVSPSLRMERRSFTKAACDHEADHEAPWNTGVGGGCRGDQPHPRTGGP